MSQSHGRGTQIRELLHQIRGVIGVHVKEGPAGIEAIDIRVSDPDSIHRITRDVESALMSGLDLELDHRLIRVAYDGNGPFPPGNGRTGARPEPEFHPFSLPHERLPAQSLHSGRGELGRSGRDPQARRVRLLGVRSAPDGARWVEITVELEAWGEAFSAKIRDADTARGRILAVGRATLQALSGTIDDDAAFVLEGLDEVTICDSRALLAVLSARTGHERPVFHGIALISGDPLETAARAVLDALNRFWAARGRAV